MSYLKAIADAFHEGGWPMWPILFLLVISWGIFIERAVYLAKAGIDKDNLLSHLKSQIMAGNRPVAAEIKNAVPARLAPITSGPATAAVL